MVLIRSGFFSLAAALTLSISAYAAPLQKRSVFGPTVSQNPFTSANSISTMHGDTASSDTTSYAGPGSGSINKDRLALQADCPALIQANDGLIYALCTAIFGQDPVVHLIDEASGKDLASLTLTKGGIFGGVYAYVDNNNFLVVGDGSNNINRIAHNVVNNAWVLTIIQSISVLSAVPSGDGIVGLSPDWYGNIWFASSLGVVGYANTDSGLIQSIHLPAGEGIANSISTVPEGTSVATDTALYLITATPTGVPTIAWRYAYIKGPGRKPGQLSWGTGSTPTIFGPNNGTEYTTIVDNAVPENVLIFETSTGRLLCQTPILTGGGSASENSPIGSGKSVIVASTYGYPYPALPSNAGTSVPSSGSFTGGLTRVDIDPTTNTCTTVWTNANFRSASVPKLSLADKLIYTFNRVNELSGSATTILDSYYLASIDVETGNVVGKQLVGVGQLWDSMQQAPLITKAGRIFQGIMTGVERIWKA